MASDASINNNLIDNESGSKPLFFPLVLGLIGLQWFVVLIVSYFLWGFAAVGLGEYIATGEIQSVYLGDFSLYNFDASILTGSVDPLILSVVIIVVVGLLIPIILSAWALASVIDTWRLRINGYRNLLTLGVGQVLVAAIIFSNGTYAGIAMLSFMLLLMLGHWKFYPDYRGMADRDFFSDLRFIRVFWQIVFVAIILFVTKFLVINVYNSMVDAAAIPTFDFLFRRAGFGINQSPDWYSSNSRYGDAFIVGVINTLQVVSIGLVLATVLGILLGIFLLSPNWLVRVISRAYVEFLRNTPLLIQLIFWYFVFWLSLPSTNITIPNESVMIVPLRYFPYLFALIGAAIFIWRFNAPGRLLNGFLTGFLIAEAAFFLSYNYVVIVLLGLIGVGAVFAVYRKLVPSNYEGLIAGAGAMLVAQLIGHILLDGLTATNIIADARIIYGEVAPAAIFGPNVFALPGVSFTPNFFLFGVITLVGLVVAVGLFIYWGTIIDRTGADIPRTVYATALVILVGVIAWGIASRPIPPDLEITIGEGDDQQTVPLSQVREEGLLDETEMAIYDTEQPVLVQVPELNRFGTRVLVGSSISPNFAALLLGLVIYTSAYIGEIVRAGIQAVPWGQVEAARALGLSTPQTLRMIILPQALRVILPPLGNQYLNLSKNSSLATAIAFSDTYQVGQTIMNQSGQSITGFFLILVVYLTLSLIISLVMNIVNSRFQLVTR